MVAHQASLPIPPTKAEQIAQAQSAPKNTRVPGSPEHCWQTAMLLQTVWQSHELDLERWRKTLEDLKQYRAWEIIPIDSPYGSLDAMLHDLIGVTLHEAETRVEKAVRLAKEAEPLAGNGGARPGAGRPAESDDVRDIQSDNVKLNTDVPKTPSEKGGNAAEYWAARLRRDAPHIADKLAAGEFKSVRAAARAAGIVKPESPEARVARSMNKSADMAILADKILEKVPQDRLVELMAMIVDRMGPDAQRKLLAWVQLALEGS
jgi:hypothetical protein